MPETKQEHNARKYAERKARKLRLAAMTPEELGAYKNRDKTPLSKEEKNRRRNITLAVWRENNKEAIQERQHDWYMNNQERLLEAGRVRYSENKEQYKIYGKWYRETHKEEIRESKRQYRLNNASYIKAKKKAYAAQNSEKISAKRKAEYWADVEVSRANRKAYYWANRDWIIIARREYLSSRREQTAEWRRDYRLIESNRLRHIEYNRQWAINNPEKQAQYNAATKANRRSAVGKLTRQDILYAVQKGEGVCPYCLCDLSKTKSHVEHMMPLSRGGLNVPDNIVIACAQCNLRKHSKTVREFVFGWKRGTEVNAATYSTTT